MTNAYLEHANITVQNLDNSVHFFQTAFPNWKIRGGGENTNQKWVHLGTDETYIALGERKNVQKANKDYTKAGINHLGFVVENVNEISERLLKNGYERSYPRQDQEFRIREYFFDSDGNEYEFVEYLSEKWEERNQYDD